MRAKPLTQRVGFLVGWFGVFLYFRTSLNPSHCWTALVNTHFLSSNTGKEIISFTLLKVTTGHWLILLLHTDTHSRFQPSSSCSWVYPESQESRRLSAFFFNPIYSARRKLSNRKEKDFIQTYLPTWQLKHCVHSFCRHSINKVCSVAASWRRMQESYPILRKFKYKHSLSRRSSQLWKLVCFANHWADLC